MSRVCKSNILIFGAPGSGKGTYGKLICENLKLKHICIGDELRKMSCEMKSSNNKEDNKMWEIMKKGVLIDDSKVCELFADLTRNESEGVLVDGFHRNIK